ncbi:MAG: DUF523 domain-containing protein, partial [Candidatus Aenigmatarchaeota archaeon]
MKIVSACLAGFNCKYDGSNNLNDKIKKMIDEGKAIPVCPEQLGGMTTPRLPSEKKGHIVYNKKRENVTTFFLRGAEETLRIAEMYGCKEAILKAKSPSC